jgi:hypothetical protein
MGGAEVEDGIISVFIVLGTISKTHRNILHNEYKYNYTQHNNNKL